jgi:hypothetical protein
MSNNNEKNNNSSEETSRDLAKKLARALSKELANRHDKGPIKDLDKEYIRDLFKDLDKEVKEYAKELTRTYIEKIKLSRETRDRLVKMFFDVKFIEPDNFLRSLRIKNKEEYFTDMCIEQIRIEDFPLLDSLNYRLDFLYKFWKKDAPDDYYFLMIEFDELYTVKIAVKHSDFISSFVLDAWKKK